MGVYRNAGWSYLLLGISMLLLGVGLIGVIMAFISGSETGLVVGGGLFIASAFLVFIFSLLSGAFSISLANETDIGTFTAAGILLILFSILLLIPSTAIIGLLLGLVAFIILGVALMNLSDLLGDGTLKTGGILTLVGGVLLIIAIGAFILLIGLIISGSSLLKHE